MQRRPRNIVISIVREPLRGYEQKYTNTYYSRETNRLRFQGHGFKGHKNVCGRLHTELRFPIKYHLRSD